MQEDEITPTAIVSNRKVNRHTLKGNARGRVVICYDVTKTPVRWNKSGVSINKRFTRISWFPVCASPQSGGLAAATRIVSVQILYHHRTNYM